MRPLDSPPSKRNDAGLQLEPPGPSTGLRAGSGLVDDDHWSPIPIDAGVGHNPSHTMAAGGHGFSSIHEGSNGCGLRKPETSVNGGTRPGHQWRQVSLG